MSMIRKDFERAVAAGKSKENFPSINTLRTEGKEYRHKDVGKKARGEINPRYTTTRVVKIDSEYLKAQRIVSFLHNDRISDQIKIMRTQVLDRIKKLGGNTILVTSANPSEGKTLIALNLAISISQGLDHTALLVEADMKTSSLDKYLGLKTRAGLSSLLMNEAGIPEVLINPGIKRLVILPAGRSIQTSAELLGSPRMEDLVKEMKERYPERFIIFDGPPLLSFADPLIFSRLIDGVLLVVEAEKTTRRDISRVMELLKDKKIIGAIYNKVKD